MSGHVKLMFTSDWVENFDELKSVVDLKCKWFYFGLKDRNIMTFETRKYEPFTALSQDQFKASDTLVVEIND